MEPIILPTAPIGYRAQSADCSIESDLLQFELLRRWTPTQRLIQSGSLMRSARQYKLLWGKKSQSEKQWRDVLSIMKTQRETLEYNYLREWTDELEIAPDYLKATIEAGVSNLAR